MKKFGDLAAEIQDAILDGPERAVALRKLLEAKDACTRALIDGAERQARTQDDLIAPAPRGRFSAAETAPGMHQNASQGETESAKP